MHYCSKCGAEIVDKARFCPKCGEVQKTYVKTNNINANDFTQIIPKVQPESTETKNYDDRKSNFVNLVIIGVFVGIVIVFIGFISYYFYEKNDKLSNTQKTHEQTTESNKNSTADEQNSTSKNSKEINKSNDSNSIKKDEKPGDYIFYNSTDVRITDAQVDSLSKESIALARNEIYARHGYVFQTEPYKSYFNNKTWYKSNANFKGSDEELNEVERYNVALLLKYEGRK